MNVNNDVQGMQQLFSSQEVTSAPSARTHGTAAQGSAGSDQATLSAAASLAAESAAGSDVRLDKVNQVQQALSAGTYNVPASEVAGKMIDRMLGK
ncbi:MAG TPA: flagellar biosynthesis anti-sigma factor FlgM [Acidobacteriaceae bacterium]|jgi:flagellar biosynthesis anti-sigma factor FlgM|nr:flagellar biosynthesis anti-sigma factor FlgM [Acidobacteriaceae bacterium]